MRHTIATRALLAAGLAAAGAGHAAAQAAPTESIVPRSGFHVGAGAGIGAVRFGTQDVYAVGTSDTFRDGTLIATGSAAGPADLSVDNEMTVYPTVQVGYFQHFPSSNWLWGARGTYSYLGATTSLRNALLPQAGAFTSATDGAVTPFTGNAFVRTYETSITHQFVLAPYIGRSFASGMIYAGAGVSLSRVETKLDGLIGFADVSGRPSDISGAPQDFSGSAWVFGGAAILGGSWFINESWFVDASYTLGVTADNTINYASTFANPRGPNGTNNSGTLVGSSSGRVVTHGIAVTINRVF